MYSVYIMKLSDFGDVSKIGVKGLCLLKKNSMVWVRERTIPTEQPPLVGQVIANFYG
jgi:hypothetical protein